MLDETPQAGQRAYLAQVNCPEGSGEENEEEAREIVSLLEKAAASGGPPPSVMVITPYRDQERLLLDRVERLNRGKVRPLKVEVCTLDRCQGREADVVLISLVRSRSSPFFDMPKRWNVALTRARDHLVIVGDIHAFRREARSARGWSEPPSLLATIIEAYDQHDRALRQRGAK